MATARMNTATEYADARDRDWDAFASSDAALAGYWPAWEARSHGWHPPIEFLQPFGVEAPDVVEALRPLTRALDGLVEVEAAPVEWLHTTWLRLGFLMPDGILWSQVETFYVNAAPRLRRIEPFTVHLGGVSVAEDARVYLGVEDGGVYREARRQVALGVPRAREALDADPLLGEDGTDRFVPQVDLGYLTGDGDRTRVAEALEAFRDLDVGEIGVAHLKLARVPVLPDAHYASIHVVAEIPALGAAHRGGYHN